MERFYGLWYNRPAASWVEALPLGNGRLGAMTYGGLQKETISINEETCWEGAEVDRSNPQALTKLAEIRDAIFHGRYEEAEEIGQDMLGIPAWLKSYQPVCSLDIHLENTGIFRNYRRQLDLDTAIHTVEYSIGGDLRYTSNTGLIVRESFVSAPDQLFVMRITAPEEKEERMFGHKGMSMDITLSRFSTAARTAEDGRLTLCGRCSPQDRGVRFAAVLDVTAKGGHMYAEDDCLKLRDCMTIEFRLAAATDYAGGDAADKCIRTLAAAKDKGYDELKRRHLGDYQALAGRQKLSLGGDVTAMPTDELIRSVRDGADSRTLFELWYNYLRYQMISSSRNCTQPSNLQGIWNDNMFPSWDSDYHPNVNMQINNWGTEAYALPECFEPVADWLDKIAVHGAVTAQKHYNARGWVLHHISDIFHCTEPMNGPFGIWPFGGAWFCRHLFEHYQFTMDRTWLAERALPLMRGSVEFMLDFLIECPKGIPGEGWLVTCPSHSPENQFITPDGKRSWLTYGAAMDIQITRDLFKIYLTTLEILGLKEDLADEVKAALPRLAPTRISERTGCIMEWIDDYEEADPGHRHVSHLYGLYPGDELCMDRDPKLLEACEKTLERRLSHDYHAAGWCCGWIANMFARLGRGNRSLDLLHMIVRSLTLPNLMVDAHGQPQVGDAQAVASAIQEMLVQSYRGEISLLPALPDAWKRGEMKGMRVRGAHSVDLFWEDGRLTSAALVAGTDTTVSIRSSLTRAFDESGAETGSCHDGVLTLSVAAGKRYTLK